MLTSKKQMSQAKCALPKLYPYGYEFFNSFYWCQSLHKHLLEMSLECGGLLGTHIFSPHKFAIYFREKCNVITVFTFIFHCLRWKKERTITRAANICLKLGTIITVFFELELLYDIYGEPYDCSLHGRPSALTKH